MVSPQEPHTSDGASSDTLSGALSGILVEHSMARIEGV
jgi:hypothetical protein